MKKIIITLLAVTLLPLVSSAQSLGGTLSQIENLRTLLADLKEEVATLSASADDITPGVSISERPACGPKLTVHLALSSTDETTGGQVSLLQTFLASFGDVYPEKLITGFYGEATEKAVKNLQTELAIVSFGDPVTTGFGAVGPQTRTQIASICPVSISNPDDSSFVNITSPTSGEQIKATATVIVSGLGKGMPASVLVNGVEAVVDHSIETIDPQDFSFVAEGVTPFPLNSLVASKTNGLIEAKVYNENGQVIWLDAVQVLMLSEATAVGDTLTVGIKTPSPGDVIFAPTTTVSGEGKGMPASVLVNGVEAIVEESSNSYTFTALNVPLLSNSISSVAALSYTLQAKVYDTSGNLAWEDLVSVRQEQPQEEPVPDEEPLQTPVIKVLSPAPANVGSTVNIEGSDLAGGDVYFEGVKISSKDMVPASNETLSFVVPSVYKYQSSYCSSVSICLSGNVKEVDAGKYDIYVTNEFGISNTVWLEVVE